MADQPNNARKKNALSEYNARLTGDPINGARRGPTLGFAVVKNNPQFELRTNVDGDKDYGRILGKVDSPTFFAILQALDEIVDKPNETKAVWAISAHRFINGQRSKEPMLDSKIMIGKDKEGVVYIAVLSWDKDRPIVKFPFRPQSLHTVSHGDGTPWTAAEVSAAYAKGWVKMLHGIIPQILVAEYVEPPQREGGYNGGNRNGGGSNGNGGYNHRGNQGGSGGSYSGGGGGGSSGGDDDFPF